MRKLFSIWNECADWGLKLNKNREGEKTTAEAGASAYPTITQKPLPGSRIFPVLKSSHPVLLYNNFLQKFPDTIYFW